MSLDLDELERLEKGATPGRWFAYGSIDNGDGFTIRGDGFTIRSTPGDGSTDHIASVRSFFRPLEDARLIAAARNALPELLARLRRAEAVAEAADRWINDPNTVDEEEFDRAMDAYRAARKP